MFSGSTLWPCWIGECRGESLGQGEASRDPGPSDGSGGGSGGGSSLNERRMLGSDGGGINAGRINRVILGDCGAVEAEGDEYVGADRVCCGSV